MGLRVEDRFWSKVDRRGPDECWPWTGAYAGGRYGLFWKDGKNLGAHRVAYELSTGQDPVGRVVRHRCDTPGCVNPAHLEIGTYADNSRDMVARSRHRVGEDHHKAKLTPEKVREIRRRAAAGETRAALAREFGISHTAATYIVTRRNWKHV